VARIKRHLAAGLQGREVERSLADVADLVTAMRVQVQAEKEELEQFLQQLTENLKELDLNLRGAAALRRESLQGSRDLDAAMQASVGEIETSVEQANDLAQLKQAVQQRLETIRAHMESFRHTEERRVREAEAEVEQLTNRLQSLEQEASVLRERIRTERANALIDPLTGIHNRLAYNERIQQEYARWHRYHTPLVFTVWDVDHFKQVNDVYGHQAGDKVLRVVARLLQSQVRETDFIARYGGEEFVILLPETELESARQVAEKLRASVEQAAFHYRQKRVPVTISCGLAQFREGDDADTVFARADTALYQAKESGRNRCISELELPEGGTGRQ